MHRRTLFSSAAALALVGLTACTTGAMTPTQLAQDASLLAQGLGSAITAIEAIPGVPTVTLTQLQTYLATIQADAAQIASATASAPATTAGQIISAVEAIAPILLSLVPDGSAVVGIANAAMALLPELASLAGLTGASVGALLPIMSPAQARAVLAAGMS